MSFMVRELLQRHYKANLFLKFHFPLSFANSAVGLALRLWPNFEHQLQSDRSRGGHYV